MSKQSIHKMNVIQSQLSNDQDFPVTGYYVDGVLKAQILFENIRRFGGNQQREFAKKEKSTRDNHYVIRGIYSPNNKIMTTWQSIHSEYKNVENVSTYFGYLADDPFVCIIRKLSTGVNELLKIVPLSAIIYDISNYSKDELERTANYFAEKHNMDVNLQYSAKKLQAQSSPVSIRRKKPSSQSSGDNEKSNQAVRYVAAYRGVGRH